MELPHGPIAVISVHADPLARLGSGQNGGMNLAVRRLCAGLAAHGVQTDIFTLRSSPELPAVESIIEGARVQRIDAGPPRPVTAAEAATLVGEMAGRIASGTRTPVLIHAHHWVGGLVAESLRPHWPVPWVQSFHTLARTKVAAGLGVEDGRDAVEQRLCTEADALVAMSRAEATELSDRYGAESSRITVIEPGTDVVTASTDRAGAAAVLGLEGKRVILYAGRLEPLKGTDTLLEALGCVLSGDAYADVVALVVGDDAVNGERGRLEAIAESSGIAGRVRFVGSVAHEDLTLYYRAAHVCVVPSRAETFGLVALEAQAAGTPVVAADVGGLREIIVDGENGYLVPAQDAAAFCSRITRLLDDADLRERMSADAVRGAARYTWDRAALDLAHLYRALSTPV